jgi:two-component sensor histidine kinase
MRPGLKGLTRTRAANVDRLGAMVRDETARDELQADESEVSRLRAECRRLQMQVDAQGWELNLLRARFGRYETALRGSHVTVFTQDLDLRYTSVTNPILDRSIEDILGRTDREILPADVCARVVALKQEALADGLSKVTELAITDGSGVHWFDLHVEPLRNDGDDIIGLAGAAIDMTERKEGEAHLRLLLRELTHRSKNLLAVIQAMARQTARHTGSTESFLDQFGARLQALASSHDILVRESWYGASIDELIRSQLAMYLDRDGEQVFIEGPAVSLRPEAAQGLGLALHELAVNAAKFGALSVPGGRLSITWERREHGGVPALALDWREQAGPRVKPRRRRGFGSMVIERNLAHALNAEVALDFDPGGVRCHVVIPASQLLGAR